MEQLLTLFFSQFALIFSLVFSSKCLRDDKWVLAMITSYVITACNMLFLHVMQESVYSLYVLLLVGGTGSSLGCGASHWFYTKFLIRVKKEFTK